jgi:leader peptidase (prepilin peptidase)/N-methyltransferase
MTIYAAILLLYFALAGLCMGSFANVVIYRLPRNESIITPPSHCPACSRRLSLRDLIPLLSWMFLKGQCRTCKVKIPFRYPAVEAACALLFTGMYIYAETWMDAVTLCVLAFVLLTVSVIDWDTQEIPDGLLITGALAGLVWMAAGMAVPSLGLGAPDWQNALTGVLAGALPLFLLDKLVWLLIKKDGFGFGDVKLMAVAGLFLGPKMIFISFFIAFIAGGVYAMVLLASGKAKRGAYMPFGPFLVAGILAALWWGQDILRLLWI